MKILYLGNHSIESTTRHRADAMERLGHQVVRVDTLKMLGPSRMLGILHYRTGYLFISSRIRSQVLREIGQQRFELVWVDQAELVDRDLLRDLHQRAPVLVNYMNDDPFGGRDGPRWLTYLSSVPEYDLIVFRRQVNLAEALARDAKRAIYMPLSYDPIVHASVVLTPSDFQKWQSEVVFVGTWMPERGPFMARLLELKVPLTIFGDRWKKARDWPKLRSAWKGPSLFGNDYVRAIQCAKIALGLLSKGNRDLHTRRTFEIPSVGTLLCAERTAEHLEFYAEGKEAVFWDDADECAEQCKRYLADDESRIRIAAAGHARVKALRQSNDEVLARILEMTEPA